jgi:hypothetical protein
VIWINLARNGEQWCNLVKAVMEGHIPYSAGNFLIKYTTAAVFLMGVFSLDFLAMCLKIMRKGSD